MANNNNYQKNKEQKMQSKKDSILKKKSKISKFHIIAIALIIAAGTAIIIKNQNKNVYQSDDQSSKQNVQVQMANLSENGPKEITYNLSDFNDGKARFFQHQNGNMTIKYFIMKSSDGKIRAAFDACDVCWREGKGYTQKGDNMICNNCGNRFPSNKINIITGGCNPGTLVISMQNGKILVKTDEILKGAKYFNFARRG